MTQQEQAILPDFRHLEQGGSLEEFVAYARYVSEAFALPDGTPVAPKGRHFDAAAKEGWGINKDAVYKAIGGVLILQEALGFVMPETARRWTDEQFLENGHWVSHMAGSPEQPMPPIDTVLDPYARLNLAPSRDAIRKRFGSWDNYMDRLGYISPTTLAHWSDQDWIDNGTWFSHMLGSPDNPRRPTRDTLREAGILRIVPTPERIVAKYGDLAGYHKALGFSVRVRLLNYQDWTREDFVQNGIWLSHLIGTPDCPRMPTADDMAAGYEAGLCPSRAIVTRVFGGSFPNYQDAIGFVTNATLARWTEEDWLANGRWLSILLGEPGHPCIPKMRDLKLGRHYNLTPSIKEIVAHFGSLTEYQEALGFHGKNRHGYWTDRQFLQYGLSLIGQLPPGSRPRATDYYNRGGPNRHLIEQRFGSLGAFHERLGMPDYARWTEQQMLNFGLQWLVRHGCLPESKELQELAAIGEAPPLSILKRHFSIVEVFHDNVRAALPQYRQLAQHLTAMPAIDEPMAQHLLRDFVCSDAYFAERRTLADMLHTYHTTDGVDIHHLRELFAKSRLTLHWEESDFIAFGKLAFGTANLEPLTCLKKLAVLNATCLSPHPQELADVFGSLDEFIAAVLADE